MGTNGLVGFRHRGSRKGTYNHCDSYPGVLGKRIVAFLISLDPSDIKLMLQRVNALTWVDDESTPSQELQERYQAAGLCDTMVSRGTPTDWYCLLRGAQDGKCLEHIKDGTLEHMNDATDFEKGHCCQYVYYIDFEEKVVEYRMWSDDEVRIVNEVKFEDLNERTWEGWAEID